MIPSWRTRCRGLSGKLPFRLLCLAVLTGFKGVTASQRWEIEAVLPEHPAPPESYLCMRVDLPSEPALKLVGIEPLSNQELVHHMLLFGCQQHTDTSGVWACQGHGVCPGGGNQQILYGWAKGAPPVRLPKGVGYRVGSGTKIQNLVLQIHFAVERPKQDLSGIKLHLSNEHVPFSAGMLMYASTFEIPPRTERHLIPVSCCYSGFEPTHGFAFRVHTHTLGRSVFLDEVMGDGSERRIVEHDPQLPQGFTPVSGVSFWPGQTLRATCAMNSSERAHPTLAGATHQNEMCNLYLIMWSELPVFMSCYGSFAATDRHGAGGIPRPAKLLAEYPSEWMPPQPLQDPKTPPQGPYLGQVAGVAKGHLGSVWVFHRGDRVWDGASFRGPKGEHTSYGDPIGVDTVIQIDQDTGEVLSSWGKDAFFMPHMITVDRWGFLWLTDVALHQVFKYDANGTLLLTLGERLKPGTGASFCKPTHVAIGTDGDVFVSDGYCNARVAHFSAAGEHLGDFELDQGAMLVPHSVVLEQCLGTLMVADREASSVHRFDLKTRKVTGSWDLSKEGLVFAVAAGPYGALFALCWDREKRAHGGSKLVLLHSDPGQGVEEAWHLEGVQSPHDLAIIAAPARLAGTERPLAALVGETQLSGSRLHKFILMPGELSPKGRALAKDTTALPLANLSLGSATSQWRAVMEASQTSTAASEVAPEIAAAKTADIHRSQALVAGSHLGESHKGTTGARLKLHENQSAGPSRVFILGIPVLLCCAGMLAAYKLTSKLHS